ncbi:MAG: carbonate dehydratase [Blastochloris sp.]|nr:carbonate dehydratase [Blastochloris sp.]
MCSIHHLLQNNRDWAQSMRESVPEFFTKLSGQQNPEYLWIGCSDSRVPANEIVGLMPGEIFVHRNVGNVVSPSDLNCLSVLQYAVDILKVKHVIVCGHYGCGGVRAALEDKRHGLIDNWLRHIQAVARSSSRELTGLAPEPRYDRLCELNVLAQRRHVCETTIVQDAWSRGQEISVHGWIYSLKDGHLKELSKPLVNLRSLEEVFQNCASG